MSWLTNTIDAIGNAFSGSDGEINWMRGLISLGGGYALSRSDFANAAAPQVGYQGEIPRYSLERTEVPGAFDPERRPGSSGQRYFSQQVFTPKGSESAMPALQEEAQGLAALNAANPMRQQRPPAPERREVEAEQRDRSPIVSRAPARVIEDRPVMETLEGLAGYTPRYAKGGNVMAMRPPRVEDQAQPMSQEEYRNSRRGRLAQDALEEALAIMESSPAGAGRNAVSRIMQQLAPEGYAAASSGRGRELEEEGGLGALAVLPALLARRGVDLRKRAPRNTPRYAAGGLASLPGKGYYLGGSTDGMADQVPAQIDGKQPAALSDGEFVIPADVVSHLGNGNSEAGAKQLYGMMDRVRQERTGTTKQGKQINPAAFMPK